MVNTFRQLVAFSLSLTLLGLQMPSHAAQLTEQLPGEFMRPVPKTMKPATARPAGTTRKPKVAVAKPAVKAPEKPIVQLKPVNKPMVFQAIQPAQFYLPSRPDKTPPAPVKPDAKPQPEQTATPSSAVSQQLDKDPALTAPETPIPEEPVVDEEPFEVTLEKADISTQVHLDVPTLVGMVEVQNLDVGIANKRVKQAEGVYLGSYGNLMPTVRGQAFVEKFTGGDIFIQAVPVSVERVTHRPRVSLDYQLPLGGRPFFQVRAAKHRLVSIRDEKANTSQTALLDTMTAYYTWLRDRANQSVAEQSLREANAYVKVNESRFKTGFGTQLEVEQARVQQAEREDLVLEARNQAEISEVELASMLNLPLTAELLAKQPRLRPVKFWNDETLKLPALIKMAEENRPDVKELVANIKEAKAVYRATFSDLLPTVGVTSYFGGVGPETDDLRRTFQRGVFLNVDLLRNMGITTLGTLKTNKARVEEAILQHEKKLRDIQNTLAEAYYDWQRYRKQVTVMKRKADAAREAFRIARARMKTGFGIQLEVLKAQTDLTEAMQELQTAILNYNTSQLRLLYETGRLTSMTVLAGVEEDALTPPAQEAETEPGEAVKTSALPESSFK